MGQALHLQNPTVPPRQRRQGLHSSDRLIRAVPPRQETAAQHGPPQMAGSPPRAQADQSAHRALSRGGERSRRESPGLLRGPHHPRQQRVRGDDGARRMLRSRALPRRRRRVHPARLLEERPDLRNARRDALDPARHDHA